MPLKMYVIGVKILNKISFLHTIAGSLGIIFRNPGTIGLSSNFLQRGFIVGEKVFTGNFVISLYVIFKKISFNLKKP